MNGFERRKKLKQKHILEAALTLFLEYGVQKVSIAEIAEKANVSQVTIYNYFESKDNLVTEVVNYYVDKIWAEYEPLFQSDVPFPEKIKQIVFEKKIIADDIHEDFFNHFMQEYIEEDSYLRQFYINTALPSFIQLFNEGKQQGYIDENLSDEAIIMYLQMYADFMRREDVYEQILPLTEDLTKMFFYGIAGKHRD